MHLICMQYSESRCKHPSSREIRDVTTWFSCSVSKTRMWIKKVSYSRENGYAIPCSALYLEQGCQPKENMHTVEKSWMRHPFLCTVCRLWIGLREECACSQEKWIWNPFFALYAEQLDVNYEKSAYSAKNI